MLTVLSAPMHRLQLLRFGQLTNRLRGETSGIGRQSAARSCSLSAGLVVVTNKGGKPMRPKWRQLGATLVVVTVFISFRLIAQDVQPTIVLFQNVRVFDGKSGTLSGPSNVLVRGNKIERISTAPIPTDRSAKTQIIDGGGRTLMPGLIDNHWHTMMVRPTPVELLTGDIGHLNLAAGAEATATLLRGFTTVRDVGGPSFGLKQAIDEGIVAGPRIFPSGAIVSVTGGHGDFRQPDDLPRTVGT